MEPLLKINLFTLGDQLLFRVVEQNENYISRSEAHLFTASNGFQIGTSVFPTIYTETKKIFLRGKGMVYDQDVSVKKLSTPEAAQELLVDILNALEEYIDAINTHLKDNTESKDYDYVFYLKD